MFGYSTIGFLVRVAVIIGTLYLLLAGYGLMMLVEGL